MRICNVTGCRNKFIARGLCKRHYYMAKRRGSLDVLPSYNMTVPERLDYYTTKKNGCWSWSGAKNEHGYGILNYKNRTQRAHRLRWLFLFGEITEGLGVLHKCDNPECTNPDHLFIGTTKDNAVDKALKGRSTRGAFIHNSKLLNDDIYDIRKLIARGMSLVCISKLFNVSPSNIASIKSGNTWSWLK